MSIQPCSTSTDRVNNFPPLQRTKRYRDIREAFKLLPPEEQEAIRKTIEAFELRMKKPSD
jgi:hypothetical protein